MDMEITLVYSENERMEVYEYTYISKMCVYKRKRISVKSTNVSTGK